MSFLFLVTFLVFSKISYFPFMSLLDFSKHKLTVRTFERVRCIVLAGMVNISPGFKETVSLFSN